MGSLIAQQRAFIGCRKTPISSPCRQWQRRFGLANKYEETSPVALIVLAIAQMGVHLVFFLHVTTDPDNTNNVLALAFGILVVGLVVLGSIWIMNHLTHNLMSMEQLMEMQP